MAKSKQIKIDLSDLTDDEVWDLPEAGDKFDEVYPRSEISDIKPNTADIQLIKERAIVTKEVAELFTQFATYNNGDDTDGKLKSYETLIEQARRYLEVKPVLEISNSNSMHGIIHSYVWNVNSDFKMPPKQFVRQKIRNSIIYFTVIGASVWFSLRIDGGSGIFSRTGSLVVESIFALLGIIYYAQMPAEYQAQKVFYAFLVKKGLVSE